MSDYQLLIRALSKDTPDSGEALTQRVIDAAQENGVAKLLYDLHQASGRDLLADDLANTLLHIARQQTAIELARWMGIRQVLGCLTSAGIPVLLLKGSALAYWLYENPAQRSRCDLDILVADKVSATRATDALLHAGYALSIDAIDAVNAIEASAEFQVALERRLPGGILHRVDLHWQAVNHGRLGKGLDFADLEARAVSIPSLDCDARGFGSVHALLHALLHRITNMPSGQQDRLIWLYDIHLLAGRFTAADWSELLGLCEALQCATPCLDGLKATRVAFDTPIPSDVEASLQEQACDEDWDLAIGQDQAAMDRAHLAALTWPQKLSWLHRKLFPSRKFMRYRYGVDGATALLSAYCGRWWLGVRSALGRWR